MEPRKSSLSDFEAARLMTLVTFAMTHRKQVCTDEGYNSPDIAYYICGKCALEKIKSGIQHCEEIVRNVA